jgi:hypothetical protein
VFNSTGHPFRAQGADVFSLGTSQAVSFDNQVNGGRWMEATWKADDGTLYGWYHFEPAGVCPGTSLTAPQIGAVRSSDNGATWQDLGIVLSAPPGSINCQSQNVYFAGGHGDFSVMLDDQRQWLYFWYGSYGGDVSRQGVALARMAWSDRDSPTGQVWKWEQNAWQQPGLGGEVTPIFPAMTAWELAGADAFWGPSVHWNTYLNQYVMLLNRANGPGWAQEGIYVSYSTDISQAASWTQPQKILDGGGWYPQVIGTGTNFKGTDKLAGKEARFFMHGGVAGSEGLDGRHRPWEHRRSGRWKFRHPADRRQPRRGRRPSRSKLRRVLSDAHRPEQHAGHALPSR